MRWGGSGAVGTGVVWVGAVRLAASLAAPPLAAKVGRRCLASYAGYASSLSLMILASGPHHALPFLLGHVFTSALASSAIQALVGEVFILEFRAVRNPICPLR